MVSIIDLEVAFRKGGSKKVVGWGTLLLLAGTTCYRPMMWDSRHRLKKKKRRQQRLQWIGCRWKRRWMSSEAPARRLRFLIPPHPIRRLPAQGYQSWLLHPNSISRSTGRPSGRSNSGPGRRRVLFAVSSWNSPRDSFPAPHTVVPVCEVVQVDAVDVGGEGTLRRVPVSLQVSLEAITVEVGAAAIARPTGDWERRCRAVFLGVSSRGQVRVFERRGDFDRGRIGISRTTAICIDYGALERASEHSEPGLTVSNRLYTIAVLSEQVRAI